MNKQSSIIMGIDPGSRITGYGIIQKEEKISLIDFGCIKPPTHLPLQKRYLVIYESVERLIHTFSPQAIAIESQLVQKNVESVIKLGMAKAMVYLLAAKYDLELFEYTPRKAKLAVAGNGSARKFQVQKMIQIFFT